MKIVEQHSHLNGYEHILVHKPGIWRELTAVVKGIDAAACRTKVSKGRRKAEKRLLSSLVAMNKALHNELAGKDWKEDRVSYWVAPGSIVAGSATGGDRHRAVTPRP